LEGFPTDDDLTEEDEHVTQDCLKQLNGLVCANLPQEGNWHVEAFGSRSNGFGMRCSDLDVVTYERKAGKQSDARSILKKLQLVFLKSPVFTVEGELLQQKVKVPILKLRYADRVDVDISVNNCSPLANTKLLKRYSEYGRVKSLVLAVKVWAKERRVCGAKDGYLSSYALNLMTIYYLQVFAALPCLQHDKPNPKWWNTEPISNLFSAFFRFYTTAFQWDREVVSIRLGRREHVGAVEFEALRGSRPEVRLNIEDPFITSHNLSCVMTLDTLARFRQALWDRFHQALWDPRILRHTPIARTRTNSDSKAPKPPPMRVRNAKISKGSVTSEDPVILKEGLATSTKAFVESNVKSLQQELTKVVEVRNTFLNVREQIRQTSVRPRTRSAPPSSVPSPRLCRQASLPHLMI
jgi:DNA polymerase sigma